MTQEQAEAFAVLIGEGAKARRTTDYDWVVTQEDDQFDTFSECLDHLVEMEECE